MNHEERRRLMEFQRDQEDRFVHDAVTGGGGVASRGGPKGGHRPLALPLAGGGAAGGRPRRRRPHHLGVGP
ncbi:MAG TPA: hypothetical protein PKA95_16190, partial [Thermomicrobiales bacterium]|nr:hypothetical protein [Thermomicrobiales bacterium]